MATVIVPLTLLLADELPALPLNVYQYQRLFGTVTRAPKIQYRCIDWRHHVDEKIANGTFSRYYRTNLQSFNKLVRLLEIPVNHRQSLRSTSSGNLPIEDNICVADGLRFLAGSMTADIAIIYGMLEQSTDRMIDVFLDKVLACEALHIKIPSTREDLQSLANGFNRVSTAMGIFKGVVSAINGWLVVINKPKESKVDNVGDYFSGHYQCYGLNVLAMCDSRLCFTYMSIAGSGRTNNNRAIQLDNAITHMWLGKSLTASSIQCKYIVVDTKLLEHCS
jgi:hypothetical protein